VDHDVKLGLPIMLSTENEDLITIIITILIMMNDKHIAMSLNKKTLNIAINNKIMANSKSWFNKVLNKEKLHVVLLKCNTQIVGCLFTSKVIMICKPIYFEDMKNKCVNSWSR